MVKGARYRDPRTADRPNATLARLPADGIVVFAVVYQAARSAAGGIELRLDRARRYPCCDGTYVPGGEYALAGGGPGSPYSVRVNFGRPPTRSMLAQAQRALDRLELPSPR